MKRTQLNIKWKVNLIDRQKCPEGEANHTISDLLTFFREKRLPVIAPYHSAIYSDGGYAILGQVLAKIAGKSVADAFKDILWQPFGMNSTSTTVAKGSDINAMDRFRLESGSMTSWGLDLDIVAS